MKLTEISRRPNSPCALSSTTGIPYFRLISQSALISHPAVLEAAVVGKDDTDSLTKPRAFVVLKPGFDWSERLGEELKAHVKETAGAWKYPRWIEVRAELPKTATGKIQRFKLREQ